MFDLKAKRDRKPFLVVRFVGTRDYTKYHRSDGALARSRNVELGKTIPILWKGVEHKGKIVYTGSSGACDNFISNESSIESALSDKDEPAEPPFRKENSSDDDEQEVVSDRDEPPQRVVNGDFASPLLQNATMSREEEAVACLQRDVNARVNLATVARNLFRMLYPNYKTLAFVGKSRKGKTSLSFQDREHFFSMLDDAYRTSPVQKHFILRQGMNSDQKNAVFRWRRHVEVTINQLPSDEYQNRKRSAASWYMSDPQKFTCLESDLDSELPHGGKLHVCLECYNSICKEHVKVHLKKSPGYDYIKVCKRLLTP